MPIRIKCKCGKTLSIPDGMGGKAVKCPGCSQVLRVPGGAAGTGGATSGGPTAKAAAPASRPSPAAKPPAADIGMSDLFDEEGFSSTVEAVCPSCRAEMAANAVLCTKCGFNKELGTQLESHKTAGVDIDHGTLALDKAADDMEKAKEMQAKLIKGGGMPWWALALVLFMIGSGLTIAVLAVNASRRVDESFDFNPLALFFLLSGCAFISVALGAYVMIVAHAFKKSMGEGFLTILPPYAIYHVAKNWSGTWRFFITAIVLGGIGGGLLGAAASQGGI